MKETMTGEGCRSEEAVHHLHGHGGHRGAERDGPAGHPRQAGGVAGGAGQC